VVIEEAGSNSKVRITNYEDILLKKHRRKKKTIPGNPEFNTPLDKIDPKYILWVVKQAYGPRVQQTHRPTYERPYLDYTDILYPYPINFKFSNFMLFNGQGTISALEHRVGFIYQCREAADSEFLKLRLFPNSLIESAFT
jgi:hypothetical protein